MALDIELLLGDDTELEDPVKRAALAAALRRQQDYGVLGQLMGVQPTAAAGQQMYEGAQGSLKAALAKQQAAKEAAARAEERKQAQGNADRQFAEQRRQFGLSEARLSQQKDADEKKQWMHAVDPITGEMRLYNQITGEWRDGFGGSGGGAPAEAPAPRTPGFVPPPRGGYGKQTEAEQKSQFYAQTAAQALPTMAQALAGGYKPSRIDQFAAGPQASGLGGQIQQNTPRAFSSEQGRAFYTAGRQVLAGILRKESGAAITDDEWQNYGPMYLPWPGDSDTDIERKMEFLYSQAENMARGAGGAYRYWTAPQYLPMNGSQGGAPAQPAQPEQPRPGDRYLTEGAP